MTLLSLPSASVFSNAGPPLNHWAPSVGPTDVVERGALEETRSRPGPVEEPDEDGSERRVARPPGAAAAPPAPGRPRLSRTDAPPGAGRPPLRGGCPSRAFGSFALASTTGWLVACVVSADGQSFQPTSGAAS